jgi:hypothetical protein
VKTSENHRPIEISQSLLNEAIGEKVLEEEKSEHDGPDDEQKVS